MCHPERDSLSVTLKQPNMCHPERDSFSVTLKQPNMCHPERASLSVTIKQPKWNISNLQLVLLNVHIIWSILTIAL